MEEVTKRPTRRSKRLALTPTASKAGVASNRRASAPAASNPPDLIQTPSNRRAPRKRKSLVSQTSYPLSQVNSAINPDCETKHVDQAWLAQSVTDDALAQVDLDAVKSPVRKSKPRRSSLLSSNLKQTLLDNSKAQHSVSHRLKSNESRRSAAVREAEQTRDHVPSVQPFAGLPDKVPQLFDSLRGIKDLYEWQKECLGLPELIEGKNLIYSLPTSGGKTLVAEVLILRQLLIRKLDAILILPFVAIVQEKVRTIGPFASELDFSVEEYAASKGQIPPRKKHKKNTLYIGTIEKAASLINSLIEHNRLDSVGLVVVDELHMLGEGGSRGATLEMTLTKVMHQSPKAQIVGMSATLNNIEDLQQFMSATVFSSDFRPVELREFVKLDETVFEVNPSALCPEERLRPARKIYSMGSFDVRSRDQDQISTIVREVIPQHSCLVFCPTKKNCENVAQLLCDALPRQEMLNVKTEERQALLKQLSQDGSGYMCQVLQRTIPFGIAYHHSGLTADERHVIEEAYSNGVLCLLTCTSTLAAGVNLPAKRVILRSPHVADKFLTRNQYKQMIGRAGRAGIDSSGESIAIVQHKDKEKMLKLLNAPYEHCQSSLLYESEKGLLTLLLSLIGLKITQTTDSVLTLIQRTLCYVQKDQLQVDLVQKTEEALQKLHKLDYISHQSADDGTSILQTTRLGHAVFKGGVDVNYGGQLYSDLKRGLDSLVLSNHLHLLFLVTPYDRLPWFKPDWYMYMRQMDGLDETELHVASLVGVSEGFIVNKAACQRTRKNVNECSIHRFYVTLMLYDLWRQKTVWEVAEKFDAPRGVVQNLLTSAAAFSACVFHFCQELEELWGYQELLGVFTKRLQYCVSAELLPLVEIPGVKIARAKRLYKAGFKSVSDIANADINQLVAAVDFIGHKTANQIISSAKLLLVERVESLREEADEIILPPDDVLQNELLKPFN